MKPALKKKQKATVVTLFDQTDYNGNSLLISKMKPSHQMQAKTLGGGFKKIEQQNKNYFNKTDDIIPPMQPAHLYDELGLSMKPKYRPQELSQQQSIKSTSKINAGQDVIKRMDQQIDKLKQQRLANFSHLRAEQYMIHDSPSRIMKAKHIQSSLQQNTLQNVQAKLQAHRIKLKQVQDQYCRKTGIKIDDKIRYLDQKQPKLKFNIDLDNQMQQLDRQKAQIYQLARKRQNQSPSKIDFEQLWEERKRKNPKIAEYDRKYQQYLLQRDAKDMIGYAVRQRLYRWDKYTQPENQPKMGPFHGKLHRSKTKEKSKQHIDKKDQDINQQDEYERIRTNINDIGFTLANKDDTFVASYIMAHVDKDKKGLISKDELYEFMKVKQQLLKGYQIDYKWLYTDLDNFETNRKGMLNRKQLATFFALLNKVKHPQMQLKKKQSPLKMAKQSPTKSGKNYSTTFPDHKKLFLKIFEALDIENDKLIKREEFIQSIYLDSNCQQLLDKDAIIITIIGKTITYRQIIAWILDDYRLQRNQKFKKAKEYITFERFCQYFQMPQSLDLNKLNKKKQKTAPTNQHEIFDIAPDVLQLLKDTANTIPRVYQEYIVAIDFVQMALRDPQILVLGQQLCRIESIQTKLPIQTIETTLKRMLKQCDDYSSWDQLKLFFSRRGRPLVWDYELIKKKKELREQKLKQQRKSLIKVKNQNFFQNEKKSNLDIPYRGYDRYTVPQPFDITDQRPKTANKKTQAKQQIEQLQKKFKAKPLNKQIFESKPDLITGKKPKKESSEKDYYKYQNYENDRIQRALKRAQEQHQIQQQEKIVKQRAEIKARVVGIDLTKKYQDVLKQQQKKRNQSKRKITHPEKNHLYPEDPQNQGKKKLEKVKEKLEKIKDVEKRKQEATSDAKSKLKNKNQQAKKLAQQQKQKRQEENRQRQKMKIKDQYFKPKVNIKQMSEAEKQAIKEAKIEKQRKKKEFQERILKAQQQRKKQILQRETKQKKLQIEGLTNQQIIQRINEVDLTDLMLEEDTKKQFAKQYKSKTTNRKQIKDKYDGLAARQRAALQAQQKRLMNLKKKTKQKVQQQNVKAGKKDVKTQGKNKQDLQFHQSKALRRYRALIQGKQPLSQYDKYSIASFNKQQQQV